jgi:hypothetical protein
MVPGEVVDLVGVGIVAAVAHLRSPGIGVDAGAVVAIGREKKIAQVMRQAAQVAARIKH